MEYKDFSDEDIQKSLISFKNFLQWTRQFKFEPIEIEPHLVSEEHEFGGTPDVRAFVMDERCLVDWKTGKIYEDVFVQLAGYDILCQENYPDEPNDGGFHVLRIPKNEDVPSFHHSHWKVLPNEAYIAVYSARDLRDCQRVLKKLL